MTREELLKQANGNVCFDVIDIINILDGKETFFRKTLKVPLDYDWIGWNGDDGKATFGIVDDYFICNFKKIKTHQIGDILYVRERFRTTPVMLNSYLEPLCETIEIEYKAGGTYILPTEWDGQGYSYEYLQHSGKWQESIYMPKKYTRIFLKIINVEIIKITVNNINRWIVAYEFEKMEVTS